MTEVSKQARELEPCPFCGKAAAWARGRGYSIACGGGGKYDWCDVSPETTEFNTLEEAAKAWNTRALASSPRIDALEEAALCAEEHFARTGLHAYLKIAEAIRALKGVVPLNKDDDGMVEPGDPS